MRLIYARYNPQCNSIDVTTFENVVLRIDCNKAEEGLRTTPGVSGHLPVFSVPVSYGKGNRPACALWAAVVYMGSLSCVPSIFPLPFFPKRLPASFLRRVPALARSPDFGTFCPEVACCGASPAGVFLFGRSFCFQGAAHR